jgi:hypothetical protein
MIDSGEAMRSGREAGPSHGRSNAGDAQVRHGEAAQPGLRLGAASGGALVANLAAGPGGRARKRRNRRRVVVRLHLHQRVREVGGGGVALRAGFLEEPRHHAPFHHRGVVGIGRDGALRVGLVRLADHPEQRVRLRLAIDHPPGVEDLVPAMLRIRLREHRQFDVGGVALLLREVVHEVVDFVGCQRQAEALVGVLDGRAALAEHVHLGQRLRLDVTEQRRGGVERGHHGFGHPVVQQRQHRRQVAFTADVVRRRAFHPRHRGHAAAPDDVGGLGGPGRDGAEAGRDEHEARAGGCGRRGGAVRQQALEIGAFGGIELARGLDQVPVARGGDLEGRGPAGERLVELFDAEDGEGETTAQVQEGHPPTIVLRPSRRDGDGGLC